MKRVIICLLIGALALWLGILNYRECEAIVTDYRSSKQPEYFCEECHELHDAATPVTFGEGVFEEDGAYLVSCSDCGRVVPFGSDYGMIYSITPETIERYTTYWKIATYSCVGGAVLVLFGVYDGLRYLVDRIRNGKEEKQGKDAAEC